MTTNPKTKVARKKQQFRSKELRLRNTPRKPSLIDRITEYLELGGLFNPELMEHDKVRDLLIDCRTSISRHVLNHIEHICPTCGHNTDEDNQCANCLQTELSSAKAEIERLNNMLDDRPKEGNLNPVNCARAMEERQR